MGDAEGNTKDGYRCTPLVYPAAERVTNFGAYVFAVCTGAYRITADIFHSISLVLPSDMPGVAGRSHVFGSRGISPLLSAPGVEDEPWVPVCDRVYGYELGA